MFMLRIKSWNSCGACRVRRSAVYSSYAGYTATCDSVEVILRRTDHTLSTLTFTARRVYKEGSNAASS